LPTKGADPIPVGKIPDGSIQVAKSNSAADGAVIIHTVTALKTLYLTHYTIIFMFNNAAAKIGNLSVRDDEDAFQYDIAKSYVWQTFGVSISGNPTPPIEIAAGWDVFLQTDDANCIAYGFIHGYET